MTKNMNALWFVSILILLVASLACASSSLIPPRPGTSNVPTGLSPMSGDWNADTKFGHLAFTVDPDGNKVVTTVIEVSSFSCGSTFLNADAQAMNSWSISEGEFSGDVDLGHSGALSMNIHGIYDKVKKTFAGTWDENVYGSHCSGKWEATPRN